MSASSATFTTDRGLLDVDVLLALGGMAHCLGVTRAVGNGVSRIA
jgi:hypothetical protein